MLTSTATSNAQPATIKLMPSSTLISLRALAPAKPGGGYTALHSTRRRRWPRYRLLHGGRRSLDMIGRRSGERIGTSRLRHSKNAEEKNCGKGGAEHGEIPQWASMEATYRCRGVIPMKRFRV
jgi:hypothetical protein